MNHSIAWAAIFGLVLAAPAAAATDSGLILHNAGGAASSRALSAEAGIILKFGGRAAVRDAERVEMRLGFGPSAVIETARGVKRIGGNAIGLRLRPGYSASLLLTGTPVVTRLTRLGAADDKDGGNDKKGPSTLGWIAIGVGGLVAAVGIATVACNAGQGNCISGGE